MNPILKDPNCQNKSDLFTQTFPIGHGTLKDIWMQNFNVLKNIIMNLKPRVLKLDKIAKV